MGETPGIQTRRRLTRWYPWLLVVSGLLVYSNSLSAPFIFDDVRLISQNPVIEGWPSWDLLTSTNRPVFMLSLVANHAAGGLDVRGYHLVNVLVHIGASLTLYGLLRLLLENKVSTADAAPALAFFTSLLWLVHPLQTEAVAYTAQRSESLMGLLYLLSLYCVIRSARARRSVAWTFAALVTLALAIGAKEVAVTAPFLILLCARSFLAEGFLRAIRNRWILYSGMVVLLCMLFATLIWRQLFLEGTTAGFRLQSVTPWRYLMTQPEVIVRYLGLSFWPHPLCLDYAWPPAQGLSQVLPEGILIVGLVLGTLWAACRRSWLGFAGAWFFGILAPTSSVMPLQDAAAEHRMYLPLASVVVVPVILGYMATRRFGSPHARRIVGFLLAPGLAVLLGCATLRRNQDYLDPVRIWTTVVDVAPHNSRGRLNLGLALTEAGDFDEAVRQYQEVLQVAPRDPRVYKGLGDVRAAQGRFEEAVEYYRTAVEIAPEDANAQSNLGLALMALRRYQEAGEHLREALRSDK